MPADENVGRLAEEGILERERLPFLHLVLHRTGSVIMVWRVAEDTDHGGAEIPSG
jgi:hypothetical protein